MMTARAIAALLAPEANALMGDQEITNVTAPEDAMGRDAVFAQDAESLDRAVHSKAGLILANQQLQPTTSIDARLQGNAGRILWVAEARLCFARLAQHLAPQRKTSDIHPSALISRSATLGSRLRIAAGVVIEDGVIVGDDCELGPRAVLHSGTSLGDGVVVKAGAVLGSAGFGFARDGATGEYVPFPQRGRLVIGNNVAIGANCTIDRGALGASSIGDGTKIDNLVHIAHNCTIGRNVVIAAQTGIAGSSEIGDGAIIAGQAGIADHVRVGAGVIVGAKAGVPSNKRLQGPGQVFWGIPARPIQQYLRELAHLKRSTKV